MLVIFCMFLLNILSSLILSELLVKRRFVQIPLITNFHTSHVRCYTPFLLQAVAYHKDEFMRRKFRVMNLLAEMFDNTDWHILHSPFIYSAGITKSIVVCDVSILYLLLCECVFCIFWYFWFCDEITTWSWRFVNLIALYLVDLQQQLLYSHWSIAAALLLSLT